MQWEDIKDPDNLNNNNFTHFVVTARYFSPYNYLHIYEQALNGHEMNNYCELSKFNRIFH